MKQLSQRKKDLIKWALYALILFFAFILQTTPRFLELFGVKPVLILPVMLFIAMFEGEWAGGVFGVVGGLFWDTAADRLLGFNAILMLIICVITGLLVMYLIRANIWNSLLVVLSASLLQGVIDYFFYYLIWDYDFSYLVLLKRILPTTLYTTLISPLFFFLIRKISHAFSEVERV